MTQNYQEINNKKSQMSSLRLFIRKNCLPSIAISCLASLLFQSRNTCHRSKRCSRKSAVTEAEAGKERGSDIEKAENDRIGGADLRDIALEWGLLLTHGR